MDCTTQAKPGALSEAQLNLLGRVGDCQGPELIRRLFTTVFPGQSYKGWAGRRGHGYSLVKKVVAGDRADGPKARRVRQDLAEDLGLPEAVLFGAMSEAA